MDNLDGCQIPCLPKLAEGKAEIGPQSFFRKIKRSLAVPWNYHLKKWLKSVFLHFQNWQDRIFPRELPMTQEDDMLKDYLQAGDWVRVRSLGEIQKTLNPFKELKGCAFLEDMQKYCGTKQRVFRVMERFLDERDYQVKKTQGIVLLEGVHCQGTPVFGRCDRACFTFWREEWLEKMSSASVVNQ